MVKQRQTVSNVIKLAVHVTFPIETLIFLVLFRCLDDRLDGAGAKPGDPVSRRRSNGCVEPVGLCLFPGGRLALAVLLDERSTRHDAWIEIVFVVLAWSASEHNWSGRTTQSVEGPCPVRIQFPQYTVQALPLPPSASSPPRYTPWLSWTLAGASMSYSGDGRLLWQGRKKRRKGKESRG